MAGEFPVDLRTWRKNDGQGKWASSDGDASLTACGRQLSDISLGATGQEEPKDKMPTSLGQPGPQAGQSAVPSKGELPEEKKSETCLPLRKRRYAVEGANGGTQEPLAGKVPKIENSKGGNSSRRPPCNGGYHSRYISVTYPSIPVAYYPGLANCFLSPELPPLLPTLTTHSLLGGPPPYSLLPPAEAQLVLDIATATQQDEDGDTPLHIAVAQGNLPVAQRLVMLFRQGEHTLDTFNNLRQTPLHLAVITGQPSMAKLLLSHRASPMVLDRNGQTALHLACEHGSFCCLQELLQGSSTPLDLETRNFDGFTPLHLAVETSNGDLVQVLLEHRADVDGVDIKSGRSPLLHAVDNNNLEMVELLLQHGANVNAQSYGGNTALHAASGRGLLDMLRLLVRNGADSSLKNYHNDSPLMVAKNKRVIDILRGKAVCPVSQLENSQDGFPHPIIAATSPANQTLNRSQCASLDSSPAIPSPDPPPKPQRAGQSPTLANLRLEDVVSSNGPSASGPLRGVKLEKNSNPPTLDQPLESPRVSKLLRPENRAEPAFHPALYPFTTNSPPLSSHHLQLLSVGLNRPVLPLHSGPLASGIPPRCHLVDQSSMTLETEAPRAPGPEGQWLHSSGGS